MGQRRFVPQVGLDAEIRHPIHFGFIDRIDHQSRGDVHAVNESQPIAGLPHGTRRHDPHIVRDLDAILLDDLPIGAEHAHALLHRRLANDVVRECVLAQADRLRQRIQRAHAAGLTDLADGHPDRGRSNVDHGDRLDGRRRASTSGLGRFRVHESTRTFSLKHQARGQAASYVVREGAQRSPVWWHAHAAAPMTVASSANFAATTRNVSRKDFITRFLAV